MDKETTVALLLLLSASESLLGLPLALFIRSAITEHLYYLKYGSIFWVDSMWRSIIFASVIGILMLLILAFYIYMMVDLSKSN